MGAKHLIVNSEELPLAESPTLHLAHPTPSELQAIWTMNSASWSGPLSLPAYLEREHFLTTVPLARNGGVTKWILVDSTLCPNERPILASCESLRKPVVFTDADGTVRDGITHGIGSVFSDPSYRGRGYATRMLRELASILKDWQTTIDIPCPCSILYSDIGKRYYTNLGWASHPSSHLSFLPISLDTSSLSLEATPLKSADLPPLCALDESRIRASLCGAQVALLPTAEAFQWHHCREDFMIAKLFPTRAPPVTKGAISSGAEGERIWAVWTRAYYGLIGLAGSGNTLYILRLVLENEVDSELNAERLKAVLDMARKEAGEWEVDVVDLWNPSPIVKKLVDRITVKYEEITRENDSIASLMWYGDGNGADIEWIANDKFGWC